MELDENLKEKTPELVVPSSDEAVAASQKSVGAQASEDREDVFDAQDDTFDALIGQIIGGHYEILSRLGAGGMSTVYKARHLLLDKFVAIKFILPKLIHDKQTAMRFKQEAKAATELNHENICAVKEFEIHGENHAFLVMEYLEGKPLNDVIAESGKLELDRALSIASQICNGLNHAHSKAVIHRDIKPGNVVLVEDASGKESVRIVDFGLAKLLREDQVGPNLTQTGEVFGTPNYMSPEQCLGKKVDIRSDIYSLGCLMHEMILGTPPFRAASSIEVIMNHVNETPDLKSSDAVQCMILKCLEKSPDKRYSSADELLDDINSLRASRSLVHAKPSRPGTHHAIGVFIILACFTFAGILTFVSVQGLQQKVAIQKQWKAEFERSNLLISQNRLAEGEQSLERALDLANQSKDREMQLTSLSNLSAIEQIQGKTAEGKEHQQLAMEKQRARGQMQPVQNIFLGIASSLILVGVGIFVLFLLLFGSKKSDPDFWNQRLGDVLRKKR